MSLDKIKVKKGVIPAGGLGSRFLPASAAIPKEIFPVFDTPLIFFAIEELKNAGVEEVFLVCSPWKKPFFESFFNLQERYLRLSSDPSKKTVLDKLSFLNTWPKITLVMQNEAKGLAEAIGLCKDHIQKDPFFVLLPDEVFISPRFNANLVPSMDGSNSGVGSNANTNNSYTTTTTNSITTTTSSSSSSAAAAAAAVAVAITDSNMILNPSEKLLSVFQNFQKSVVGLFEVLPSEVSSYGVVSLGQSHGASTFDLTGLVEKPKPNEAPSNFMLPGRYLFTSDFWLAIQNELDQIQHLKLNQELHITLAMDRMAHDQCLMGEVVQGLRFDVGRPEGLLSLSQEVFKSETFKSNKGQ